jgi:hypothetical protein
MRRVVFQNADVVMLAVACCFGAGLFLTWAANGFRWSSPARPAAAAHPVAVPRTSVARPTSVASPPTPSAPKPRSAKPARAKPRLKPSSSRLGVTLTLVATRGSAWVSLHAGSPAGRTLYEGLLPSRRKITVTGPRFAARFQASSNLVALIGGRRSNLGRYELRNVVITRSGIRLLASARPSAAPAVTAS